jgi:hypothetical protein
MATRPRLLAISERSRPEKARQPEGRGLEVEMFGGAPKRRRAIFSSVGIGQDRCNQRGFLYATPMPPSPSFSAIR